MGDVCCDLAEFLFCVLKPSQCGCSPSMDYNLQGFTCTFQNRQGSNDNALMAHGLYFTNTAVAMYVCSLCI